MKLLVLSDSHGSVDNMVRAVEQTAPGMIVHLGDCWRDGEKLHGCFPDIPFQQVPGNCDFMPAEPATKVLCLEDKRVLLCHGHTYGVKQDLLRAVCAAREERAALLLFGHTHRPLYDNLGDVQLLNPGSIGDYARPAYGLVWLERGTLRADLFSLER